MNAIIFIAIFVFLSSPLSCQQDEADDQSITNADMITEADLQHIPDVESDFSCEDRNFGYYADIDSGCSYFHLCHPIVSNQEDVLMAQFTFLCPNETIFRQKDLDCEEPSKVTSCADSEKFFFVNDQYPSPKPLSEFNSKVVRPM